MELRPEAVTLPEEPRDQAPQQQDAQEQDPWDATRDRLIPDGRSSIWPALIGLTM